MAKVFIKKFGNITLDEKSGLIMLDNFEFEKSTDNNDSDNVCALTALVDRFTNELALAKEEDRIIKSVCDNYYEGY